MVSECAVLPLSEPGGGTTDYAVYAYLEALGSKHYTCFLRPDTLLPMMYMPDCIRGTVDFLEGDFWVLNSTTQC